MKEQTQHNTLTNRESRLAGAMLHHKIGIIAAADDNGRFVHEDFGRLVNAFRDDPKESLAYARESLFAVGADKNLDEATKEELVDEYLDAYFDLTIRLDRAAFPNTNQVNQGVPEYLPDGFIDMGSSHVIDPRHRSREQLWVDKHEVLTANKDLLKRLFLQMPEGLSVTQRKQSIVQFLALQVHAQMRQGDFVDEPAGDKMKLSVVSEGICRHQSMLFQVLAQAMGVQSRLMKCSLDGTRHVANAVRIDGAWRLIDVANPDYSKLPNGGTKWEFSPLKINAPKPGEVEQYDVIMPQSGEKRLYTTHNRSFWRIEHP